MDKLFELLKKFGIDLKGKEDELKAELETLTKGSDDDKTAAAAKIKELETELAAAKAKPNPNPNPNPNPDDKDTEIVALRAEIKSLTDVLAEMKTTSDASVEATKVKLAKERDVKIAELKKKGSEAGKITEANWDKKYKALCEKDPEGFESILEDLAVDPHFKPGTKTKEGEDGGNGYKGPLDGADRAIMKSMTEMQEN